jgi:folate-binding protein YgfZ
MDAHRQPPAQAFRLDHFALLHLEGPDAATFFQGYGTCDTRRLNGTQALEGALCNRQGQVLATFLAWGTAEALTLRLHETLVAPVSAFLEPYLHFAKCALRTGEARGLALTRDGLGALPPLAPGATAPAADGLIWVHPPAGDRELWGEETTLARWCAREGIEPGPESPWLARSLAAGRLPFTADHSEQDVPQGFNLDRIGAVDFKKGCYLGQEIVARLHYRGQPKRRLYRGQSAAPLAMGEAVRDASGNPLGTVLACAAEEAGAPFRLALSLSVKAMENADGPFTTDTGPLTIDSNLP